MNADSINIIEGSLTATNIAGKIVIVASRFNDFIVDKLVAGAIDTLSRHGYKLEDIVLVKVPGAFELPLVTKLLVKKNSVKAVVALGAIIRGSTPHFDFVANECTKGLAHVSLEFEKPVVFGVLTVDSIEQAIERAGTKMGNKGAESAIAVIEMLSLDKQLENL